MSNFADYNFIVRWNKNQDHLKKDMVKALEAITKWLKQSGLKVNENMTELCLFNKKDMRQFNISLNGAQIAWKSTVNVLGVTFDFKLQGTHQVANQ